MYDLPPGLRPPQEPEARRGPLARFARFVPLLLVLVALLVAIASGALRYLSLPELQAKHQALQAFVHAHPLESLAGYILVAMAVIALSLPGSLIVTLAGGYLFGVAKGAGAAVVGETIGAVIMYFAARSAFGEVLRRRVRVGGLMHKLAASADRNAFSYLLTLRLIPGIPFFLVNLAAGLVGMRLSIYLAGTVLGIIPSTLIYTSVGAGLGRIFSRGRTPDLGMALEPQIYLPMIGLAILAAAPVGYQIWRARQGGRPRRVAQTPRL